jgi:TonB family protein
MRPVFLAIALLLACSCAAPRPAPVAAPEVPAPAPAAPAEEIVSGTVRVTASALNVRREPSADAEVIAQVKKGTSLGVLRSDESWMKVRLADGRTGWVAERFVAREGASQKKRVAAKRGGCPADSDFAFLEAPLPAFSDSGAHGLVIVEATVNAKGSVTSTKVVSNATGDEALAFLAAREIKSAKFSPPIRDCGPRAFVYTYRKMF